MRKIYLLLRKFILAIKRKFWSGKPSCFNFGYFV